jgi:hypothetical protein
MFLGRVILLMLIALTVWTFSVHADVTGSFSISAILTPTSTQTEAQKMDIDLRTNLQLMVTISGLSFGVESLFGTFGLEEVLLSATTNLGALRIRDELFFSIPYYVDFPPGLQLGQLGQVISPTVNGDGVRNGLGFVRKKLVAELNIAGITLTNTALFEDVDFPSLGVTNNPVYHLDAVDSIVGNQTPTYGFGDILELSGQTVSGITISAATYLCTQFGGKVYKSRVLIYRVNPACTAQFGQDGREPLEDGAKTPLLFDLHLLSIENIEIGGINVDAQVQFTPFLPLLLVVRPSFSLLDLVHVSGSILFSEIPDLMFYQFSISTIDLNQELDERERFVTNGVEFLVWDFDGDFVPDRTAALFATILNPNQNPAWFATSVSLENPDGLTSAAFLLAIDRGPLVLETATTLSRPVLNPGTTGLSWQDTSFSLSFEPPGSDLQLTLETRFSSITLPVFSLELEVDSGLLSDI